jgi:hypothetical protein
MPAPERPMEGLAASPEVRHRTPLAGRVHDLELGHFLQSVPLIAVGKTSQIIVKVLI